MTEVEKMIIEELRAIRKEFKSDIIVLHAKVDKNNDGQQLFKGKVFGVWAVITVLLNIDWLHLLGKK